MNGVTFELANLRNNDNAAGPLDYNARYWVKKDGNPIGEVGRHVGAKTWFFRSFREHYGNYSLTRRHAVNELLSVY